MPSLVISNYRHRGSLQLRWTHAEGQERTVLQEIHTSLNMIIRKHKWHNAVWWHDIDVSKSEFSQSYYVVAKTKVLRVQSEKGAEDREKLSTSSSNRHNEEKKHYRRRRDYVSLVLIHAEHMCIHVSHSLTTVLFFLSSGTTQRRTSSAERQPPVNTGVSF